MKTIFSLAIVLLFASTIVAQENKSEKKTDTAAKPQYKMECYMFQDGALFHVMDDKKEVVKVDVKLKNGTILTPSGNMMTYDGTKTQLEAGQCVSLMGGVGICEKMIPPSDGKAK